MNMLADTTADLAGSVRHMVHEADQFLKVAAERGDARFDAVRGQFIEQVRHVRAQLDDLESETVRQARHVARKVDRTVHAHPYRALGIAAAIGLLAGLLASRR